MDLRFWSRIVFEKLFENMVINRARSVLIPGVIFWYFGELVVHKFQSLWFKLPFWGIKASLPGRVIGYIHTHIYIYINIYIYVYIYIYGLWLYYLINWSYILWVFNTNICIYIFLIWCVTFRNIPYANSVINEYRYTQSTLRNTTKLSEQGSYDATRDGPLCIQGVTGKMIIE